MVNISETFYCFFIWSFRQLLLQFMHYGYCQFWMTPNHGFFPCMNMLRRLSLKWPFEICKFSESKNLLKSKLTLIFCRLWKNLHQQHKYFKKDPCIFVKVFSHVKISNLDCVSPQNLYKKCCDRTAVNWTLACYLLFQSSRTPWKQSFDNQSTLHLSINSLIMTVMCTIAVELHLYKHLPQRNSSRLKTMCWYLFFLNFM